MLAEGEHVAFDPQMSHANHTDQALIADRRHGPGEGLPGLARGNQGEGGLRAKRQRHDRIAHPVAHREGERHHGRPALQPFGEPALHLLEVDHRVPLFSS